MTGHRRARAGVALAAVLALGLTAPLAVAEPPATEPPATEPPADRPTPEPAMYRNAVSDTFSDTFADPAVIQAKDGWWYAYSTADPLYSGDEPGVMHIARTKDWSDWEYLGTVFDQDNRPAFAEPTSGLWAPDVRYLDGRYVLHYSVTDTTLHAGGGTATVGEPTMVATDNRYEGSFVVRRGDWYYLLDAAGRDFIVYHAQDRNEPWLSEPFGINRRPMLIDRLDRIDGWPVTRAGAGPSDADLPAPVVGSDPGITADDPAAGGVAGLVPGPEDPQAGATARISGFANTAADAPADRLHLGLDFRTDRRLQVTLGDLPNTTTVDVDPKAGELKVVTRVGRDHWTETIDLAGSDHWRRLAVDVAGSAVTAAVSESGLSDDEAVVRGGGTPSSPWPRRR